MAESSSSHSSVASPQRQRSVESDKEEGMRTRYSSSGSDSELLVTVRLVT